MNRPAAKLDIVALVRATHHAHEIAEDHLARAKWLAADGQKTDRESKGLCPTCFYLLGNAGGDLCKRCGGDRAMRTRRRK